MSQKCQRQTCLTNSSFGVADWHAATPSCLRAHNTGWRSTGLHDPMPTPDTEPKYHSHTQWKCRLWSRPARKRDNADRRSEPVLRRWPPSFPSRGLSRSVRAFEPPLRPTHTLETAQHERYQGFDLAPAALIWVKASRGRDANPYRCTKQPLFRRRFGSGTDIATALSER
jgi:hypothetical protein